ncbi:nucleotidyltransferase family protein [Raineya orbicola]|uniref:Putative nucleotidyltransferase n=1 Tax=Raineya orbicola TaxID=2016530 RepID=A0A2N3IIX1_9BACT|nr:nucleotidyltransferase domain-containing protein [Raineya orbicola]PKQ70257.1 putative nucleotidyltransferase [Raineya orbicola]
MKLKEEKIKQIQKLCEQNNVKSLYVFGSVLREDFNDTSDIDFLIDFSENDPFRYTDLYFSFKQMLEEIVQRKIDLLEERAIRNPLLKNHIDSNKQKLY